MNIKACLSHNSDDWKTPTKIYNKFIEKGWIDTFPYKAEYDELKTDYYDKKLFCNPPFSKMEEVTNWVIRNAQHNAIALLIPARTDTKYMHKLLKLMPTMYLIKGRLKYNDSKSAPFPTILLVFHRSWDFMPIYRIVTQEELIGMIN